MVVAIALVIVGMLLPILMIVFGSLLSKNIPEYMNSSLGYRTKRSTISKDTWDFANKTAAMYWIISGKYCLPVFILLSIFLSVFIHHNKIDDSYLIYFIIGLILFQLIPFLSVIPYTEKRLRDRYK